MLQSCTKFEIDFQNKCKSLGATEVKYKMLIFLQFFDFALDFSIATAMTKHKSIAINFVLFHYVSSIYSQLSRCLYS